MTSLIPPRGFAADLCNSFSMISLMQLVVTSNCVSFLFGFDVGVTCWIIVYLCSKSDTSNVYAQIEAHVIYQGLIAAMVPIGAFLGCLVSLFVDSSFGRRDNIQFACILYAVGSLLQSISGAVTWNTSTPAVFFVIARALYGLGVGIGLYSLPPYVGESAPSHIRGQVASIQELSIVTGMGAGYMLGGLLDDRPANAYYLASFLACCAALALIRLPMSPRYMLLHEELYTAEDVLKALRFIHPYATHFDVIALRQELSQEQMQRQLTPPVSPRGKMSLEVFKMRKDRTSMPQNESPMDAYCDLSPHPIKRDNSKSFFQWPTLLKSQRMRATVRVSTGLMILQQLSGMTACLYYAGVILVSIGLIQTTMGLALMGFIKLVCAVIVTFTVDFLGRKMLLTYGNFGMLISALTMSIGFFLGGSSGGTIGAQIAVLIGFYAFIAAYALSVGPVAWVLLSELFPAYHQREAQSLAMLVNFGIAALLTLALPSLVSILGYGGLFACFSAAHLTGVVFISRCIVETKTLSLNEIQQSLAARDSLAHTPVNRA